MTLLWTWFCVSKSSVHAAMVLLTDDLSTTDKGVVMEEASPATTEYSGRVLNCWLNVRIPSS